MVGVDKSRRESKASMRMTRFPDGDTTKFTPVRPNPNKVSRHPGVFQQRSWSSRDPFAIGIQIKLDPGFHRDDERLWRT